MTEEEFHKTRWFAGDLYRLKTDKFLVVFGTTINCYPSITSVVHRKVINGEVSYRSGGIRYVCNGIYYKNQKDFLERCNEKFTFYGIND